LLFALRHLLTTRIYLQHQVKGVQAKESDATFAPELLISKPPAAATAVTLLAVSRDVC
jgi:hypothetical protein